MADTAFSLLKEFVSFMDVTCDYDHNDFCQTHYHDRPCLAERALAFLSVVQHEPDEITVNVSSTPTVFDGPCKGVRCPTAPPTPDEED